MNHGGMERFECRHIIEQEKWEVQFSFCHFDKNISLYGYNPIIDICIFSKQVYISCIYNEGVI